MSPSPASWNLPGYHRLQDQADGPDRQATDEDLRTHLPRHMVAAYLEELPVMPVLPDGKADRKNLPRPAS